MTTMNNKVLVLSPHTDDAEIGCGGTISRFLREGNEVTVACFSGAVSVEKKDQKYNWLDWKKEDIWKEFDKSMEVLGVKNIEKFTYQARGIDVRRNEVLDRLIEIRNRIKPDLVICPASTDIHQDHRCIFEEAIRAFKNTTIIGFFYPWNSLTLKTDYFITLDKKDLETKIRAIKCYKSQKGREYVEEDFIRGWARTSGIQIGKKWAEAYEAIRIVK
jgi:LmbE family N-acetylglucosaminyl deacetylase